MCLACVNTGRLPRTGAANVASDSRVYNGLSALPWSLTDTDKAAVVYTQTPELVRKVVARLARTPLLRLTEPELEPTVVLPGTITLDDLFKRLDRYCAAVTRVPIVARETTARGLTYSTNETCATLFQDYLHSCGGEARRPLRSS